MLEKPKVIICRLYFVFSDIFTTVIEMKWRWCLLYFSLSFISSWTIFACIYYRYIFVIKKKVFAISANLSKIYSISLAHGDMEAVNQHTGNWTPCIKNVNSLLTYYLFSFETQSTIGYGFR